MRNSEAISTAVMCPKSQTSARNRPHRHFVSVNLVIKTVLNLRPLHGPIRVSFHQRQFAHLNGAKISDLCTAPSAWLSQEPQLGHSNGPRLPGVPMEQGGLAVPVEWCPRWYPKAKGTTTSIASMASQVV